MYFCSLECNGWMLKQVWRLGPDLLGEPKFVAFISKTTARKIKMFVLSESSTG